MLVTIGRGMERRGGSGRRSRRGLALALAATLSAVLITGCGDSGRAPGSAAGGGLTGMTVTGKEGTYTTNTIPPGQTLRGDGDADNPTDTDGNGDDDGTVDGDVDTPTRASYDFPDADDTATLSFGRAAVAADAAAVAATTRRFYAAAVATDGAVACSLFLPSRASTVPEDHGYGSAGPAYLRPYRTCATVMSALFRHEHQLLTEQVTVVKVREQGARAQAIVSSRALPASLIYLQRRGTRWYVEDIFGTPLS